MRKIKAIFLIYFYKLINDSYCEQSAFKQVLLWTSKVDDGVFGVVDHDDQLPYEVTYLQLQS